MLRTFGDDISYEEAATTEPLATSLHAVNLDEPQDGETHVIIGAGIIGLGVLQCIKAASSAKTIVVDLSSKRLAMASELGSDVVTNAVVERKQLLREQIVPCTASFSGSPQ